jgi:hypothetical protein
LKASEIISFSIFQFSISIFGEISPITIFKTLKLILADQNWTRLLLGENWTRELDPCSELGSELDESSVSGAAGYPVDVFYSPPSKPGRWTTVTIVSRGSFLEKREEIAVKRQERMDRCCVHTIKYIPTVEYILMYVYIYT